DAFGNVDPLYSGRVTLALGTNPGGGALSGTLTATAVNGVATFPGLSVNNAGNGYTVQATANGLTAATTTALNVTPHGKATRLVITVQPPGSVSANSGFGITVKAEDDLGAVDANFGGPVTVALGPNPSGTTIGGMLAVTAVNGVATFNGLTVGQA